MIGSDSATPRSTRPRSFVFAALLALVLCGALAGAAQAIPLSPTDAALPGSDFQGGDGDQDAENGLRDWQSLVGMPGLVSTSDPNALDTTFDTGSHENDPLNWDIDLDPAGVTPAKANFFNSWSFVDEREDTFLYLAFNREVSGGNVFLAFELNQDTRSWINASGDAIQCRTEGDLIVSYEIQNDDDIDVIIQRWVSNSEVSAAEAAGGFTNGEGCSKTGEFDEINPSLDDVQGAINTGRTITNYLPGAPATLGEELFGEAAINLTDIFEGAGLNPCFSFGQISLHGRSSESDSASMQDLVGPVPLLVRSCTISGTKYHDIDGDGATPPDGEPTLAGWKLYLDLDNDNVLDANEPTTLTDANGNYTFEDLSDGTFTVREAPDSAQAAGLKGFFCSFPSKVDANCEYSVTIDDDERNATGKDFANYRKVELTVEKQTVPDGAAGSFGFTFTGQAGFNLSDGGSKTFTVDPGVYTSTESVPAGWTLTDITCSGDTLPPNSSDAGNTATFNAQSGEKIKCVFTNTKDAKVTIVKDAVPNDAQDFGFTGSFGAFSLDDDADGTLDNDTTFTVSGAGFGSKTVTESAVAGWSLTDITCSEGSDQGATATLQVDPGDEITCTFTNKKDAKVTIVKDAVPNDAQDFGFTGSFGAFSLDDDADGTLDNDTTFTVSGAGFGSKTVTESAVAGWSLTDITCSEGSDQGATATLQVDPGDEITCTFTNKKDAKVTIVKDAVPNDAQDFGFTGSFGAFSLDDDADGTLDNDTTFTVSGAGFGSKTVTESAVAGWSLTDITCSEGSDQGATATLQVDPGDEITCTFTNKEDAKVTIVKDAVPNDAQDFGFTGSFGAFSLDDDADGTLDNDTTFTVSGAGFGSKTVTESAVAGWSLTDITCSEGSDQGATATLQVDPGDEITCTFTNKKDAKVTIVKDAVPNDAQDFGFTGSFGAFSLDDDADGTLDNDTTFTVSGAGFGSKTVTESAVAGWSLTDITCSEGSDQGATATLQVDPGDEITCTFTNKKDAKVTIVKDAVPNDAQDFGFTGSFGAFSLDDDADGTLDNDTTFTVSGAGFGSKTVTEGDVEGWALTSLTCDDDDFERDGKTAQLDVEPGEQILCTFVNEKAATVRIVKDAVPNDAQDFAFTTTGSGMSDFSLDDDADGTLDDEKTFVIVGGQFGSKTVSESAVAGWSLTDITCSEGSDQGATATLQVDPGDEITCTFTNKKDAKVTIVKDAVPNDAQDFGFTGSFGAFLLDDDADGTLDDETTFTVSGAGFGEKTVTESAVAGWDLTGLECSEGAEDLQTRTATLSVEPGDVITCTYENTKRASVTVTKTEANGPPALTWTFRLTGGPDNVDITKNTNADGNPLSFGNLRPGNYRLCEINMPAGWHSSLEEPPFNGEVTENPDDTTTVCVDVVLEPGEAESFTIDNTTPSTLVVKEGTLLAHHGELVTYTFDVSNTGNIALQNIVVSDDKCPNVSPVPVKINSDGDDLLENPGQNGTSSEVWRYTCSYTLSAEHSDDEENPIVNTVTATGEDIHGNPVSDTDTHETRILHPDIDVDKQVRRAGDTDYQGQGDDVPGNVVAHVGDTVEYRFLVTDGDSDTPIGNVQFSDPRCDAGTVAGPVKTGGDQDALLEDGEVWTYTCSHVVTAADPDPLPNTGTVTGEDETGKDVDDSDSTSVDLIHPAIDIEKTGPATATVGAALSYTLTVTNPGDVSFAAQEVVVTDPKCEAPPAGPSTGSDATPGQLDPGDTWTYTCTAQTAGQLAGTFINTANVSGKDFLGKTVTDTDDFPTLLEAQVVIPETIVNGTARLRGPSGCVRGPFKATVRGSRIARVTFFVDGKRFKRVSAPNGEGARFTVSINPRGRGFGVHRVTARVEFAAASQTRTRTLRLSFQRCRRQVVKPRFTG